MIKVLFVCEGNICRSPMAEGIFQDMVDNAGLSSKIKVDSAGTSRWHNGEPAHPGTRKVLREHGITYNGRSRLIRQSDMDEFDYVLAMDSRNLDHIERLSNSKKAQVGMFLSYANRAKTVTLKDVPDPYYTGEFDRIYELVSKGCEALMAHLRDNQVV